MVYYSYIMTSGEVDAQQRAAEPLSAAAFLEKWGEALLHDVESCMYSHPTPFGQVVSIELLPSPIPDSEVPQIVITDKEAGFITGYFFKYNWVMAKQISSVAPSGMVYPTNIKINVFFEMLADLGYVPE